MKNKLIPLHDRVVVQPIEIEKQTAGGIIIPDTVAAKDKPMRGKIIACGKGKAGEPMTVKAGETVLYEKNVGVEMEVNGTNVLIIKESNILAII